jgi:hypothetical protein
MTDDEKLVDKQLREHEQREAEVMAERGEEESASEVDGAVNLDHLEVGVDGEDPDMFKDGDDESVDS